MMTIEQMRKTLGEIEDDIHSGVEYAALITAALNSPIEDHARLGAQRLAFEMADAAERVREAWRAVMEQDAAA